MNRTTDIELGGKKYTLNLSVQAMLDLSEMYGDNPSAFVKAIMPNTDDGESILSSRIMANVLKIGAVLIKYGAEYRRVFCGEECETLSAQALGLLSLTDAVSLHSAIIDALTNGNKRKVETEPDRKNAEATQV